MPVVNVWFNKSTDPDIGTWDAGYFRGVVDKASKVSAKGIQTLEVDYPDEMTSGELQLVRQQLLDPKDAPAKPTVEQGEVAVRVPEEALPQVEETATPFGLSPEQHAKLKELWYERGHYASRYWRGRGADLLNKNKAILHSERADYQTRWRLLNGQGRTDANGRSMSNSARYCRERRERRRQARLAAQQAEQQPATDDPMEVSG